MNLRTIDYSREYVRHIVAALQERKPAIVLLTAKCLWAAMAAELCGIPTAVIHTNALLPRGSSVSDAVYAARWPGKSETELAEIEQRDRREWERLRNHYAISRIHDADVLPGLPNCMNLRGDLNVVYTSSVLQPQWQAFDASYHFVGPCYDARAVDADAAVESAIDRLPRPLIYCALGSMRSYNDRRHFFQTVLSACSDGRFGVVMSVGSEEAMAALGRTPAHVLVRPYVPQLAVLARTSLFITHAGTNSVYESLLAGVPMLMCPQGGDQPIFAEHIESLGAGRWLHEPLLDAKTMRAAVESMITDAGMAQQAKSLGESLRSAGGIERAADLITEFSRRAAASLGPLPIQQGLAS